MPNAPRPDNTAHTVTGMDERLLREGEAMTLTEFLLARITEREAVARDASLGHRWTWTENGEDLMSDHLGRTYSWGGREQECIIATEGANPPGPKAGAHIALNDPERVLRRCEADRRIVEYATGQHTSSPEGYDVLRLLALPDADHPDYREEWKP